MFPSVLAGLPAPSSMLPDLRGSSVFSRSLWQQSDGPSEFECWLICRQLTGADWNVLAGPDLLPRAVTCAPTARLNCRPGYMHLYGSVWLQCLKMLTRNPVSVVTDDCRKPSLALGDHFACQLAMRCLPAVQCDGVLREGECRGGCAHTEHELPAGASEAKRNALLAFESTRGQHA